MKFSQWLKENVDMTLTPRLYANIQSPYPGAIILYLQDIQTRGQANTPVSTPDDIKRIIAENPKINAIMFSGMKMPRKAVPLAKVDEKLLIKQFKQL